MDETQRSLSVFIIWTRTLLTNLLTISYCYLSGFTIISIGGLALGFLKLMETILLQRSKPSNYYSNKIKMRPALKFPPEYYLPMSLEEIDRMAKQDEECLSAMRKVGRSLNINILQDKE